MLVSILAFLVMIMTHFGLKNEARVFEGWYTLFSASFPLISLAEAGWIGRDAILMTGINAIIYLLSTVPP